jgi:LacI family transcriptional regulator
MLLHCQQIAWNCILFIFSDSTKTLLKHADTLKFIMNNMRNIIALMKDLLCNSRIMAKVNQQELAKRLSLSQTTVSRALANHPAINAETKALVLETAAMMGYSQRIKRGGLPNTQSHPSTIGVLISMPKEHSGPSETFQQVLRGIADKSSLNGFILDVVYHDPGTSSESGLIRRIKDANWIGVLMIYPIGQELAQEIANLAACVSIIENYRHDLIDSVDVDQSEGILSIVNHLHEQGHKRIAYMSWAYRLPTPWVQQRFGSFVQGLYTCGLEFDPDLVLNVRTEDQAEPSDCTDWATARIAEGTTAIICAADHQAYHLMHELEKKGIRVPEEVSITGFDGIPPAYSQKQLATIKVNYEELGRSAVHQLLRRIEQPTAPRRHILVDGDLIIGETTQPPASLGSLV